MLAGEGARATQHLRATRGLRPNQYFSIVGGWAAICPSHSLSFGYVARCVPPTEKPRPRSPVSEYNFSCQFSVPSYQLIAGYGPARGPLLLRRLTGGGASPRQLLTVESCNSKLARRLNLRSEAFVHVAQAAVFDNDRSSAGGFAGG